MVHLLFLTGKGSTASYQHNAPCNSIALVWSPISELHAIRSAGALLKKNQKRKTPTSTEHTTPVSVTLFAPPLGFFAVGSAPSVASDDGGCCACHKTWKAGHLWWSGLAKVIGSLRPTWRFVLRGSLAAHPSSPALAVTIAGRDLCHADQEGLGEQP